MDLCTDGYERERTRESLRVQERESNKDRECLCVLFCVYVCVCVRESARTPQYLKIYLRPSEDPKFMNGRCWSFVQ